MLSKKNVFLLFLLAGMSVGCTTTRTSNTDRTGLEQMLISNAIDQAVDANQFTSVNNRNVFVDEKYLECTDQAYVLGSIRSRVLDNGGRLVDSIDNADVVMEVRSGGVGTDNTDRYVGIPGLSIPGMPIELPEVRLWERNSQFGTAKIAITCFDTQTGRQLESSGNLVARSDNSRWNVLGFSAGDTGSVNRELARSTYNRPTTFSAPQENFNSEMIAREPQTWR